LDAGADNTQELLEKARDGDAVALEELFARHREQLRRAVAFRLDRRVAARIDVSDVVQETYLEAAPGCRNTFSARICRSACGCTGWPASAC
jgi:RNA polymerase sigma-70 factor (ECF subfamily)